MSVDQLESSVNLGKSPRHARSAALILSLLTGYGSARFHIKHDELFETVRDINTLPQSRWQELARFTVKDQLPDLQVQLAASIAVTAAAAAAFATTAFENQQQRGAPIARPPPSPAPGAFVDLSTPARAKQSSCLQWLHPWFKSTNEAFKISGNVNQLIDSVPWPDKDVYISTPHLKTGLSPLEWFSDTAVRTKVLNVNSTFCPVHVLHNGQTSGSGSKPNKSVRRSTAAVHLGKSPRHNRYVVLVLSLLIGY